jgi:hypothetical protein
MINKIDSADGTRRSNKIQKKEKRAEERLASRSTIIFSYFSSKNWTENHSSTLNISAGGMCFESRHSFKPHANLFIRTGQHSEMVSNIHKLHLLRTSTLAEVRWCREMTGAEGTRYSVGIKYL